MDRLRRPPAESFAATEGDRRTVPFFLTPDQRETLPAIRAGIVAMVEDVESLLARYGVILELAAAQGLTLSNPRVFHGMESVADGVAEMLAALDRCAPVGKFGGSR